MPAPSPIPAAPVPVPDGPPPQGADLALITRLRRVMNDHVGVIRGAKGLDIALREILAVRRAAKSRAVRNMATTALLIAAAARVRHESRGGHYRSDATLPDPAWARRSRLTLAEALAIAETVDNPVAA
jgi:L-aspartate oxidase